LTKKQHPIFKLTIAKRAGGVAQVVDYLPGRHEALSSTPEPPTPPPKKKKKKAIIINFGEVLMMS
jgi:hypothetical protein